MPLVAAPAGDHPVSHAYCGPAYRPCLYTRKILAAAGYDAATIDGRMKTAAVG